MAYGNFKHVSVAGLCAALPTTLYKIEDLAEGKTEKEIKRFKRATGVKEKYLIKKGQTTSDLAFVAAEKIINDLHIDRDSIDGVFFLTQSADYLIPSSAIVLQERLGLKKDCMAYDINLGCSGFVYGLFTAAALIESGAINRALVLTGDVAIKKSKEMLFGDAATATLLERGNDGIKGLLKSDGSGFKALITTGGGARHPHGSRTSKMDGDAVFQFTITDVPEMILEFCAKAKKKITDYDFVVLHQANEMMLKHIISKLKIAPEKSPIVIGKYGNTNGASVPLAIADLCENLEDKTNKLEMLVSGFGIGLSYGAVSMTVDPNVVLPIQYTDYFWDEKLSKKAKK